MRYELALSVGLLLLASLQARASTADLRVIDSHPADGAVAQAEAILGPPSVELVVLERR